MKLLIVAFLLLLVAGIAFGVGRDLYSTHVAMHDATVIRAVNSGQKHKSPTTEVAHLIVLLADGREVRADATSPLPTAGSSVRIEELAMPWGQVWFRQVGV